MRTIRVIGLPTDINSSFLRGPAKAPEVIRRALASDHSSGTPQIGQGFGEDFGLEDVGDLELVEGPSDFDTIRGAVSRALGDGVVPFCLGGDHSISYPAVAAVAAVHGPVSILHFDAHPDLYDDYEGNPSSHASPFARILEAGLAKDLVQVGIRTLNRHQADQVRRFGVKSIPMLGFEPDMVPVLEGPVYVSFDLDGLDPSVAPGVSHHEPGGLTVREVLQVLDRQTAPVVGADLVELNPDRDINGVTATLAAKLVREISALIARNGA
jgi:agmatinase